MTFSQLMFESHCYQFVKLLPICYTIAWNHSSPLSDKHVSCPLFSELQSRNSMVSVKYGGSAIYYICEYIH